MDASSKTALAIAFVVAALLLLGGGMMGRGSMGGISWMWLPTLLVVVISAVLLSVLFGKKQDKSIVGSRGIMRKVMHSVLALTAVAVAPTPWLNGNSGFGWNEAVAASHLAAQTSSAGGVTIKVTPQNMAGDASWDLAVVFDTHSANLDDDLVKSSLLIDSAGGRFAPLAWDGAPPGGHHREGVLRFKTVSPLPQSIELQIKRTGEDAPRSFRWQLK